MILITRPEPAASFLKEKLYNHTCLIDPVMRIEPVEFDLPAAADYDAIIFTSVHGVEAYTQATDNRKHHVYCVGETTARAARAAGFEVIKSCNTARDVALSARQRILYVSGTDVSYDFSESYDAVQRVVVYRAAAVDSLSQACQRALIAGEIKTVLFFSARSVEIFARLMAKHNIILKGICAVCISDRVAQRVKGHLPRMEIKVAQTPDQKGMIVAVNKDKGDEQTVGRATGY